MELYINNGTDSFLLALKPNTKINLSIYNPMFSNVGLFSQLINVYRTENDRFFNYAAQLQSIQSTKFTFKLLLGADVMVDGDVKITDSDDDNIEFYLKSGNSSVSYYLKNTLMTDAPFWGTTNRNDFEDTVNGNFPEYNVVTPPIMLSPGFIRQNLPAIYLRYIINTLITAFGYAKINDDFDSIPDSNRVAIFAPHHYVPISPNHRIEYYLPDILISEFLDDVLLRFNHFIYFSPTSYEAEVLNFSKVINTASDDWTNKFKRTIKLAPSSEKQISFTNESPAEGDNLPVSTIEKDNIISVNTIADLPFPANRGFKYYVIEEDRYYDSIYVPQGNQMVPQGDFIMNAYQFSENTESIDGQDYYKIEQRSGIQNVVSVVNTVSPANVKNKITQFVLHPLEGKIETNISFTMYAEVNTGTSTLVTEAYWLNTDTGEEINVGQNRYDVLSAKQHGIRFRSITNLEFNSTNRLIIKFFSISTNDGRRITLKFGDYVNQPFFAFLVTDEAYYYWREYGRLNRINYGSPSNEDPPTVITPKGKIPLNIYGYVDYVVAEIPQSSLDIAPVGEQNEFEWLVYRGKKQSAQIPDVYVPHCNYDDRDLKLNDYASELLNNITPTLTLKWNKNNGILNKIYTNRLPWERYLKRKITLDLELTLNDIFNRSIYKPFTIKESKIIAEKITLTIDVFDNITNQQVEGYTL